MQSKAGEMTHFESRSCGKYEGPVVEDLAFFDFKMSMAQMRVILCKLSGKNFGREKA